MSEENKTPLELKTQGLKNPSPIGTQRNPVSSPDERKNPVEKELEERKMHEQELEIGKANRESESE